MTQEGEEGASLGVAALLLASCSSGGVSNGNEIGGRGAAEGVREPTRGGGTRLRLRENLTKISYFNSYHLRIWGSNDNSQFK